MKYIITTFVFIVCVYCSYSQYPSDSIGLSKDTVGIFTKVDVEAGFAGGVYSWSDFLQKNLNLDITEEVFSDTAYFQQNDPKTYEDMKRSKPNSGKERKMTAIVKFIVYEDGSLNDIQVTNKVHPLIEKEVIRVIKKSPRWVPAQQNQKIVTAYRIQPITFVWRDE